MIELNEFKPILSSYYANIQFFELISSNLICKYDIFAIVSTAVKSLKSLPVCELLT